MVTKRGAPRASTGDKKLAQTVGDSAQQIWLAGLGAFAKTQAEGTKVFDALVKEGRAVHAKTRKAAERKVGGMSNALGRMAANAGNQTTDNLHKLEQIFEKRFARTLNRVVVPISKGIQNLAKRVEKLSVSVHRLAGGASKKTAVKKTATKKTAARKSARRKPAK